MEKLKTTEKIEQWIQEKLKNKDKVNDKSKYFYSYLLVIIPFCTDDRSNQSKKNMINKFDKFIRKHIPNSNDAIDSLSKKQFIPSLNSQKYIDHKKKRKL
jgi:hypothetical protein